MGVGAVKSARKKVLCSSRLFLAEKEREKLCLSNTSAPRTHTIMPSTNVTESLSRWRKFRSNFKQRKRIPFIETVGLHFIRKVWFGTHMALCANNFLGYKLIGLGTSLHYLNDFRKFRNHKLYGTPYGPQGATSEDELEKAMVRLVAILQRSDTRIHTRTHAHARTHSGMHHHIARHTYANLTGICVPTTNLCYYRVWNITKI